MEVKMSKDDALYGLKKQRNLNRGSELSSSQTLSFTSQLSSLIQASSSQASNKPRPKAGRSSNTKEDIFKTHNRNAGKRAARDLAPDIAGAFQSQQHTTKGEAVDSAMLQRSKRKMEEKARLYAAMKRGDLEDTDGRYAVDFDQKWVDAQNKEDDDDDDDDSDDDEDAEERARQQEQIEYIDEFGRTRTGTRLEAQIAAQQAASRSEILGARPAAPEKLIRGDTIQHHAFAPSDERAEQIANLAAKRDRSLTPPPETHFDGNWEMRTRGTGFFGFSRDEGERRAQMDSLEAERRDTERLRAERDAKLKQRRAELEKRREEVQKRRAAHLANEFLETLKQSDANGEVKLDSDVQDNNRAQATGHEAIFGRSGISTTPVSKGVTDRTPSSGGGG